VPLKGQHRGQRIDEVQIDDSTDWRQRHRDMLLQACRKAPFCGEMLALLDLVLAKPSETLADLSRTSLMALAQYFGLDSNRTFIDSHDLVIGGSASERLLNIVRAVGGDTYVTGHGAKNYLDHALFEKAGISVRYMSYRCTPYPQLHGEFTPYVTALDLIANCGKQGRCIIASQAIPWRDFIGALAG
jgi:hypothetical protein